MKNKIVKTNMTKFDYTARKLGIVGVFILTITFAFGGAILLNLVKENQVLLNALAVDVHEEKENLQNNITYNYNIEI